MENSLKPRRFETLPDAPTASKEWSHWFATFENYIEESDPAITDAKRKKVLVNFLSFSIYEFISECTTYKQAINTLKNLYVKPKNEVFARFMLLTRKQDENESIDQYLQSLKALSKECNFKAVSAEDNRDDLIRDSFINGLISSEIRKRLLENDTLPLEDAVAKARAIEAGSRHAQYYISHAPPHASTAATTHPTHSRLSTSSDYPDETVMALNRQKTGRKQESCWFCGKSRHPRSECPAREALCQSCKRKGHFAIVCMSKKRTSSAILVSDEASATIIAANPGLLRRAVARVSLGRGLIANCLVDTGSTCSYVSEEFATLHKIPIIPEARKVSMASTCYSANIKGYIITDLKLHNHSYTNLKLSVLPKLCADVLLGHDVFKDHSSVTLNFGGPKPPLEICSVAQVNIEPVRLFTNLSDDIKPIATKSRRHSQRDSEFIIEEVRKLLADGIIEESQSPWRAQVLVVENENHKRRMCIDYSQTINKFTNLDAYPVPNIDEMVSRIAQNTVFSTLDLKSAYHQVPIHESDRPFTAFEAGGSLYQFRVIAFGLTNGVAGFQRFINKIIQNENLSGVYAYIDDVTVCGKSQEEHDTNLKKFLEAVKKYGITLNDAKCKYSQTSINILGHAISNHEISPDPDRMKSLIALPPPVDSKSLQRVLGIFAHYSKWISKFSEKIRPLIQSKSFPLAPNAIKCFEDLKNAIANAAVITLEDGVPLQIETDASDVTIAATLSQRSRPVAFFSRTLSASEKNHSAIEKEAAAIVECMRKWRHFLIGRHFTVITDQEALSFIFDMQHSSRIKNDKIMRWRLELSAFQFDIIYRPGKENIVADALSRVCGALTNESLYSMHDALCHPGITRMFHWLRSRNLPYTLEEVRRMTNACPICAEIKPRYHRKQPGVLIKATQPFERISMDFKGPLPSATNRPYILTVVDEYSRFPFAFPCKDLSSSTVIRCLTELFTTFGMPSFVHSDRGASFMSREVSEFLHSHGTSTSHSTPYSPQANGQVEKYNDIVWKAISLALRSRKLKNTQWEQVLPDALHSIRSLLCTATNCTPHERMFHHQRRSTYGNALPSWLSEPGTVLLKRHNRTNKYEPQVEEVHLVEANPEYALVRHSSGREDTVSLRHLAPRGDTKLHGESPADSSNPEQYPARPTLRDEDRAPSPLAYANPNSSSAPDQAPSRPTLVYEDRAPSPRGYSSPEGTQIQESSPAIALDAPRPTRNRHPPAYLRDYDTSSHRGRM